MNNHPFHLVDKRPWPITGSMGLITTLSGIVIWFHNSHITTIMLGNIIIILTIIQWWRDVIRESRYQGLHTIKVINSIKIGIIIFILSEVLFFIRFFWAFFHSSLAPRIEIGIRWPPLGITSFNPINIPILNTIILLRSGITITWAHHSILTKNYRRIIKAIVITVSLGIYFSLLQLYEYIESPFCMSDSIYGSTFFLATGFHGLHVIIGTIFILISTKRNMRLHISKNHHVGFEASAWYWHFVDVVWLFLYVRIYWWGIYLFNIISILSFQLKSFKRKWIINISIIHLLVVVSLIIVIIIIIIIIRKKRIIDWQKSTPFECGFNPMRFKRLPFSVHFFLIAVIFLIFDIEIIIILPIIFTLKRSFIKIWIITSILFIVILIVGLYHEWNNGILEWTK